MDPILLLIPVMLPVAGGLGLLMRPVKDVGKRKATIMALTVLTSVVSFALLFLVKRESRTLYSFTEGFSIALKADGFSILFAGMLAVLWPLVILYAFSYMEHEHHQRQFFACFVMTYGITLGIAFAANMLTMYVFFEMLTIITVPLVIHKEEEDSLFAGRRYLRYCMSGAALGLAAVVTVTLAGGGEFVYGGGVNSRFDPELMRVMFLAGFFGFGVKAAVFPVHAWLPTAFVAPTPVTALLHAVAVVNTGMFCLGRLVWYAFGTEILLGSWAQQICVATAGVSLLYGAAMALKQRHLKRRLAYSTMSNLSYMLFGVALMTPAGFTGAMAHMLFHSVMKMTLFLCAGAVMHMTKREYIYEMEGIGRKMPVTFACFTISALSLSGIPPLCGFVSKWQLLQAGIQAGTRAAWFGTGALLTAAFLCAIYTLTICIRAFFPRKIADPGKMEDIREADWRMLVPVGFFTVLNLVFGIWQAPVLNALNGIATGLY